MNTDEIAHALFRLTIHVKWRVPGGPNATVHPLLLRSKWLMNDKPIQVGRYIENIVIYRRYRYRYYRYRIISALYVGWLIELSRDAFIRYSRS